MRHEQCKVDVVQKYQPKGYSFVTDNYDLFQVIHVCVGRLMFESGGVRMELGPGDMVVLRQGSGFVLSCPKRDYRGVAYHVVGELPDAFIGKAESLRADADIQALVRMIQGEFSSPGAESQQVCEGLGRAMAWKALRLSQQHQQLQAESTPRYWADAGKKALDAARFSALSTREALSCLPMSYRQLARHFTDVFGVSPKQYQLYNRIEESRRLLENTGMSVTNIAMELGFSSSQHFATQFRAVAGMSPSVYRRQNTVRTV